MPKDSKSADAPIKLLLGLIDEGYEKKAWHGPNLKGSIRRIDPETAAFRPAEGRHNIWEQVLHAAYWKYIVRRRLLGEQKGSFPLAGSNWFTRPTEATVAAWKADVRILDEMHRSLRKAIAEFPASKLSQIPSGSKTSNQAMITGIAAHDVYHAGQIQLLKRLAVGSLARNTIHAPK